MPELATLDQKTLTPPKERIEDVNSLNAIVKKLIDADDQRARNRVYVQQMLDGKPPLDPTALSNTGQADRVNLNFGEGAAALESALTGYHDLVSSVDTICRMRLDLPQVSVQDRSRWEAIINEEFHQMVTDWPDFESERQYLYHQFVAHGVAAAVFNDEVDWRWSSVGLDRLKVPDGAKPSEYKLPIAVVTADVDLSQMYQWISDESTAMERGWNVEEVKKAMLNVSGGTINNEWEKLQQLLKNNDIFVSETVAGSVKIAMVWVKEFTGKASFYITLREGGNNNFLFKSPSLYDSMGQALVIFSYGIGTNGTLHSVRGLAHKIYPFVQVSNQLRCQMVEAAKLSSSVVVQPVDENSIEEAGLVYYGGFAVLHPKYKVQQTAIGNPSTNALPVVRELSMVMQNNTGSYQSHAAAADGQERTKFEVSAALQQEAVLSTGALALFYQPWGRLVREQVRRAFSKTLEPNEPGGAEAFAMRERCLARGVPEEALYHIGRVDIVRSIGGGSPAMRSVALDELSQMFPAFNEQGKNNLLRDRVAARVGYSQADRYVPELNEVPRPTYDELQAQVENSNLLAGMPAEPNPQDNPFIHLAQHIPALQVAVQAVQQLPEVSVDRAVGIQNLYSHIADTVDALGNDTEGARVEDVAALHKVLSQLGVAVGKVVKAAQPQQDTMTPEMQMKMQNAQLDMQIRAAVAQQKLQQKQADFEQRQTIRDAQAQHRIINSTKR